MTAHIGSRHHRIILDNEELAFALADAMRANDMPGMADIDSSLLLFCREVRKQATVVLSGECADEIFGGYPWYVRQDLAYAGTFPWSGAIRERGALLSPDFRISAWAIMCRQNKTRHRNKVPLSIDTPERKSNISASSI
jgi:asparagine synthase (glutamine-hydrolysing)